MTLFERVEILGEYILFSLDDAIMFSHHQSLQIVDKLNVISDENCPPFEKLMKILTEYETLVESNKPNQAKESKFLFHPHILRFGVPDYQQYSCNICGKEFQSTEILRCDECKYDVCDNCCPKHSKISLHLHMLRFGVPDYPRFVCDVCGKEFQSTRILRCAECQYDVCIHCSPVFS